VPDHDVPPCRWARFQSLTLSNAFSAASGWTAGPASSIVTKSVTNNVHGEALYMGRPPTAGEDVRAPTSVRCAPSALELRAPTTLTAVTRPM